MPQFLQLHLLVSYPPSNVNRDDLGRPKSAVVGGAPRLRISSQSLKRAWRTSRVFTESLEGNLGIRTKEIGHYVEKVGLELGVPESEIRKIAKELVALFGGEKKESKKDKDDLKVEQLVFLGTGELTAIKELLSKAAGGSTPSSEDIKDVLKKSPGGVDVAMFGRMLASAPMYNVEAATQVAHAFSVNKVAIEDDYFTAVDDLKSEFEREGAAHIGVSEYGAGVFYEYICIDCDRLLVNLGGDKALASQGLRGLVEAACTVSPTGKQNSFAHGSYVSYALAERGTRQPRSLASSFVKPVTGQDVLVDAIERLRDTRTGFDQVFGACAATTAEFSVPGKQGTLSTLIEFVSTIE
jgi:CRISPR system Cascade subunit CasC